MADIPIYASEYEAGLAAAIRSSSSVALASEVRLSGEFSVNERTLAHIRDRARATNLGQPELHYLKSVLVTAGWEVGEAGLPAGLNRNDDFFDDLEVWVARHSPEDKPFNHEHDCADIIGHITDNHAVTDAGEVVSEDCAADALPGKYHLVTSSVLYKSWEKPELQERMDRILAEVSEGKWYVSMECLFAGFDYIVMETNLPARAVARNKETAFLTKHLRAYGGTGTYQGQKVGRLLRNIVFSGMGLVRRPANPESVIFANLTAPNEEIAIVSSGRVYCKDSEDKIKPESPEMSVEIEALQKQLAEQATAREKVEAEVAELMKRLAEAGEANEGSLKSIETLQSQLAETEKRLQAAAAELTAIQAERKRADRLAKVVSALKVDTANAESVKAAEKFVDTLTDRTDEAFEAHLQAVAQFAPPPAKSSPSPSPSKGAEADPAAKHADTKALETAETTTEVALATETDAGAESVRVAIASYFGWKAEDEDAAAAE